MTLVILSLTSWNSALYRNTGNADPEFSATGDEIILCCLNSELAPEFLTPRMTKGQHGPSACYLFPSLQSSICMQIVYLRPHSGQQILKMKEMMNSLCSNFEKPVAKLWGEWAPNRSSISFSGCISPPMNRHSLPAANTMENPQDKELQSAWCQQWHSWG